MDWTWIRIERIRTQLSEIFRVDGERQCPQQEGKTTHMAIL
jgi:hypothetical protein